MTIALSIIGGIVIGGVGVAIFLYYAMIDFFGRLFGWR